MSIYEAIEKRAHKGLNEIAEENEHWYGRKERKGPMHDISSSLNRLYSLAWLKIKPWMASCEQFTLHHTDIWSTLNGKTDARFPCSTYTCNDNAFVYIYGCIITGQKTKEQNVNWLKLRTIESHAAISMDDNTAWSIHNRLKNWDQHSCSTDFNETTYLLNTICSRFDTPTPFTRFKIKVQYACYHFFLLHRFTPKTKPPR